MKRGWSSLLLVAYKLTPQATALSSYSCRGHTSARTGASRLGTMTGQTIHSTATTLNISPNSSRASDQVTMHIQNSQDSLSKDGSCASEDWSGGIIVRFLQENLDQDYEIKNKPKARVDPSSVISETNHVAAEENGTQQSSQCDPVEQSQCHGPISHIPDNAESCIIRIDMALTSKSRNQDIKVNLIRDGAEEASNCLKRLELSLVKKFSKKQKGKKKKEGKNIAASSCSIAPMQHSERQSEKMESGKGITNAQFWAQSAASSMKLRLSMDETEARLPVECNPPTVYRVTAFENFDCEIFPHVRLAVRIDTLFATRAIVDWYANGEKVCHDSTYYVPTLDDVGKSLAIVVTPSRNGYQGTSEAYLYQRKVASILPPNTTLKIRKEWLAEPKRTGDLRVMSYNILADQNAFTTEQRLPFFPYVHKEILLRSRRCPLILEEILAHKADVICLQEVDSFVFTSLLQPALESYNYQGFYSLKQSSGSNEGCAVFWSLDRFETVETKEEMKTYKISELLKDCLQENSSTMTSEWKECTAPISELFAKRKDLKEVVLSNLGHVLQLVKLRDREGKSILVANTHLFFHPMGSHIRALQLFAVAHQLSMERGDKEHPFLFIGDLNSSVGNAATLILKKHLPSNYRDYKESLNNFSWDGNHGSGAYTDDFPAMSIPKSFPTLLNGYAKELPPYTHYIVGFKATIDHILFSEQSSSSTLRPKREAPIPSLEEVTRHQAMPSPNFPSDHISLVCDLEWTKTTTD